MGKQTLIDWKTSMKLRSIAVAWLVMAAGAGAQAEDQVVIAPKRPKLVVVLSIDQFRGDYIERFRPWFGKDGFVRLIEEGRYYRNCNYWSGNTVTGPGHATLLTGTFAHRNGITGNEWYDEKAGKVLYCVGDATISPLTNDGVTKPEGAAAGEEAGSASPRNLLAGTAGDELENATNGSAHTLSISNKDRAAVLMGGHAVDMALWFDGKRGEFVSSAYYGQQLPEWIRTFNSARHGDAWFKKTWDISAPRDAYEKLCTVDDFAAESDGGFGAKTFPKTLGATSEKPDAKYYSNLVTSPYASELLIDAALAGVAAEGLGKDDVPDLLTVSISSTDYIGHAFGPDSWEVMDCAIKTDATVGRFLKGLDDEVGKGNYSLFVSADHGVVPLPEAQQAHHIDAKRVLERELRGRVEVNLAARFGPPVEGKGYITDTSGFWVRPNRKAFAADSPNAAKLDQYIAEAYFAQPDVFFASSTSDLLHSTDDTNPLRRALLYAYYPSRCGDVTYVLKPNYLMSGSTMGTSHGTPWRYDQYVPMLAFGAGIAPGMSEESVTPPMIGPTVSALLGVPPPNMCEVGILPGALK
ncbi:alkaline phosphatase family protein [soil metagenome]